MVSVSVVLSCHKVFWHHRINFTLTHPFIGPFFLAWVNIPPVETIGDAYIVIAGGPEKCEGREGAERAALFALDCIDCVKNSFTFHDGSTVKIRAGIASGLVIAGVVGTNMPKFTLYVIVI